MHASQSHHVMAHRASVKREVEARTAIAVWAALHSSVHCSVDVRLVSNQERATQAYASARTSFRTMSFGWRNAEAVTLWDTPATAIVRFAWAATVENKHTGPASAQRVYPATSPAGSLHRTEQTPTSADEESEEGDEEARERRAHHLVQN